jgi:hypothetical protein
MQPLRHMRYGSRKPTFPHDKPGYTWIILDSKSSFCIPICCSSFPNAHTCFNSNIGTFGQFTSLSHVSANLLGNPTSRDRADHMISQESTNVRQTLGSHIEEFGNHGSSIQHSVERSVDINMERRAEADIPPGLGPVDNMCQRWYHASIIKNDILYIYGGYETFVDSNNHGNTRGSISIGTSKY